MPRLSVTILLTALTLVAFAANSILCRAALADRAIDPASFSAIRLSSGAVVLLPWLRPREASTGWRPAAAFALLTYALLFSFSYVALDAGTGALLLFGFVQLSMLGIGWLRGERPGALGLAGIVLALAGVVWLVAPGVTAPDPWSAAVMAGAGVAWGVYSLLGRGEPLPAVATARNFAMAAPPSLVVLLFAGDHLSTRGVTLAVTSGAVTSGLGYVLWYAALRGHTRTSAAVVQLLVPAIAATGGIVLLGEAMTGRLLVSAVLTLGGVGLAIRRNASGRSARRSEM